MELVKESFIKQYPISDYIKIKESNFTFPNSNGKYGVEIPVINNLKSLELAIRMLKEEGVDCSRFNETHGSFLLSDSEISEMLALCSLEKYGFVIGLGPRPEYDVKSSFYRSKFGLEQGRSINNNTAIWNSVEEAIRVINLGVTGITVYDIGVLKILNELREKGLIPKKVKFKTSSHCMASNYSITKIYDELGADSITTLHDLDLPVLQTMRELSPTVILDIPVDVYKTKGGFIRFQEMADMVKCASPIYFKMGASAQNDPYDTINESTILKRINRVKVGLEVFNRNGGDKYDLVEQDSEFNCLPDFNLKVEPKELTTIIDV